MYRTRLPLLAFAALLLLAAAAFAQAPAAPKMFIVHVENPIPSKIAEYEASVRDFKALLHDNHKLMPSFGFTVLQGEDLSYAFVGPIRSFADIDGINTGFEALGKAAPERWAKLMDDSVKTMNSYDERVFMEINDASYWPANAKNSPTDAYLELDFYRVIPGMEEAAAQIAASWKALYQGKNVPYGYNVYRLALGENAPLWLVTIPAKDPADLAMMQETIRTTLGAAFQAQMAKTMAATRGFEVRRYRVRQDLSLPPATK